MKDEFTSWAPVPSSFRPVLANDDDEESSTGACLWATRDIFSKGTKQLLDAKKKNHSSTPTSLCDTIASTLSEDDEVPMIPSEIEFMVISRQSSSTDSDWCDNEQTGDLVGLQFVTEDVHHHEFMSVQSVGSVTIMSDCGSFTTVNC